MRGRVAGVGVSAAWARTRKRDDSITPSGQPSVTERREGVGLNVFYAC